MNYSQTEVNLHTHSFYCRHGIGTIEEYVREAERLGNLKVLGFSEHCPLPDRTMDFSKRMDYDQLPLYEQDIRQAQEKTKLTLLTGAECDGMDDQYSFYKDELLCRRKYDYLIGSIHGMTDPETGVEKYIGIMGDSFKQVLSVYVKKYIKTIESGIFLFCCHPDLLFASYKDWNQESKAASLDILQCAKECNVPLEINDYGLRKKTIITSDGERHMYPMRQFWELAKDIGIKVTANSDAHDPLDVQGKKDGIYMNGCFKLASELGIEFVSWSIENGKINWK